jgi:hypothetical protein
MKRKTKHRQTRLKTKLGLPDLEHAKLEPLRVGTLSPDLSPLHRLALPHLLAT